MNMRENKCDITAIGELLIDFASVDADGEGYPLMKANPGGAPCNFLAAAANCGLKTAFIGKVGNDAFGKLLRSTLERTGVNTRGLVMSDDVFTTLAFVTFDKDGDRSFSFARKPGADQCLTAGEIDHSIIGGSRAVHFGSLSLTGEPSRSAVLDAVTRAKSAGKIITYDPNLRLSLWSDEETAKQQIKCGLKLADIVKVSDDETQFLFGNVTPEQAADRIINDFGAKLVMVTSGAKGCLMKAGTISVRVPCPVVNPVDTTGAGDIFGGTAIAQLLCLADDPLSPDMQTLTYAGRFAQCAASLSTEKQGGISSIPELKRIQSFMDESFS